MRVLYLYPGQLASSEEPALLSTLLGSCVGVALHDPARGVGGLNHFLLPRGPEGAPASFRYGDHALEALALAVGGPGGRRSDLRAKIYGGNSVVEGLSGVDVGSRNIAFAREWLGRNRIPVLEEKVAAERGCRITLDTRAFAVEYRLLTPVEASPDRASPRILARKARALIVDDSATVRSVFRKVLEASGQVEVVGAARDPYEARELLVRERPDVVLLDIEMPRMSGVEFLGKVMTHMPTPVIMVSSLGSNDAAALRCLEIGAVEFVHKPSQFDPLVLRELADALVAKVLVAASEPVERLKARSRYSCVAPTSTGPSDARAPGADPDRPRGPSLAARVPGRPGPSTVELVLVGGNAGSQYAFRDFLAGLAADTPPVVACVGPVAPFAARYCVEHEGATVARLRVAADGQSLSGGEVSLVPHGHHARVEAAGPGRYVLRVTAGGAIRGQAPSAGELFASACVLSSSRGVVALLLSGFGTDGVEGLVALRERGAHTVVVRPETAPFPHAPEEALRLGAADEVVSPADLAPAVMRHRSRLVS